MCYKVHDVMCCAVLCCAVMSAKQTGRHYMAVHCRCSVQRSAVRTEQCSAVQYVQSSAVQCSAVPYLNRCQVVIGLAATAGLSLPVAAGCMYM